MRARAVRRVLLTAPARLSVTPGRQWLDVPACTCPEDRRRGPVGGVCAECGGGILTDAERAAWEWLENGTA